MKILHIIAGSPMGGAETFCLDSIKALHAEHVDQHVLCRPHDNFVKALRGRGIARTTLTFSRWKRGPEQKIIARIIEDYKPDIIHCWMSRASSLVPAQSNIPVLGWFGGYYALKNYRNCDFYMGVTKDIVRHIIDETGAPHRTFLVHTFGTLEEAPPVKKADFDVPENAKTVLLLSRMHWKKGVDTLLDAALQLKDAYFLLAGDGPDIKKYKKMSKKMGLDHRVRFLGWRNDRAALLKIADVCVLPSCYEPFGTVIAESWFAKTPLVATKAAGARQYVAHNENGLLCEIDDSQMLARNLEIALYDQETRRKLIENGQKSYEALFSKGVVVQSLLRAYQYMMRMEGKDRVYVDADESACSEFVHDALSKAIRFLRDAGVKNIETRDFEKIAGAYILASDDISLVMDTVYIQATGLYNFMQREKFKPVVEILSEADINRILENETYITSKSLYRDFAALIFSKEARTTRRA